MTTAMMMDRAGMMMPGMTPGMSQTPGMGMPAMPNMVMVPRCTVTMEKVANGMKMTCKTTDAAACTMMQNLFTMMAGGMCSVCCMMNGMTVCCCNLTMGVCKCEMTKDGCVLTCTSGDKACCDMIQCCCDCMTACMKAGCCCCVMMGGTPCCCSMPM